MDFHGRRALVTGAAGGIGRAVASHLVDAGATVLVTDLDLEGASRTARELGAASHGLDVADSDQYKTTVERAVTELGGLDIIVNAAGIEVHETLEKTSIEMFNRSIAVNLTGMFNSIKYGAPALRRAGGGALIGISSIGALGGGASMGSYCAAKAGVLQLVRTAALELRADHIRVNAVLPGLIQTPMVERTRSTMTSCSSATT